MPGSTFHIIFADMLRDNASPEYYAGAIAIDAVSDYHLKDKTHFRKMENRSLKIAEFAKSLPRNDFYDGMITHLYLDMRWDMCEIERFKDELTDDWFLPYRSELSKTGHYLSNTVSKAQKIWDMIYKLPIENYGEVPLATTQMVENFIKNSYKSQKEQKEYPMYFYPDEVECFLKMAALEYPRYLKRMGIE